MKHYIDKSALVAEIDRLENKLYYEPENFKDVGAKMALDSLKSFLNTLEVKEVQEPVSEDLEKIVEEIAEPAILNAYGTKELARRLRNTIYGTSVSEDLEEAAKNHAVERYRTTRNRELAEKCKWSFKTGAKWKKEHLWKPADGDELPEIDKEVVAFQETFPTDVDVPSLLKIVIAHRPNPEGYDGKSITTGQVEHYTPKTYGKGGWNIPDLKYWLDVELPKEIEL